MDAEDFARRLHEQLTRRAVKDRGLLAHVTDDQLRLLARELGSPFTDAEKDALVAALRSVATEDALHEVLVRHVFIPTWNHWWVWLLAHWDEVEKEVDYERGRADRCRAYEAKLRDDPVFAAERKMYGHWRSATSAHVVAVWQALEALRDADELGDEAAITAAMECFTRLRESDETYWEHVTDYWTVDLDWRTALLFTEKWLQPQVDTIPPLGDLEL